MENFRKLPSRFPPFLISCQNYGSNTNMTYQSAVTVGLRNQVCIEKFPSKSWLGLPVPKPISSTSLPPPLWSPTNMLFVNPSSSIIIITRPKPAYGRQGLDWIVGPGYSFLVFSTKKTIFFIFISTPEGHERGTFWRVIISFQSGTENID